MTDAEQIGPLARCVDDLAEAVGLLALVEPMMAPQTEYQLGLWQRVRECLRKHGVTPSGVPDE